jgi:hypothetical protein
MDTGKILLVDLSGVGSEAGALLGSFILSLLRVTAVGRSDIPYEQRKDFHIYCDEAHKFLTTSLEDLIPESRKYKVSFTLAHQYLRQFPQEKIDSISTTGTAVIFNIDMKDAMYLAKDLQVKIKPEAIADFRVGDAVVRIDGNIVRIKTFPPLSFLENSQMQRIIDESHRKFYSPALNIKEIMSGGVQDDTQNSTHTDTKKTKVEDEYRYDELN